MAKIVPLTRALKYGLLFLFSLVALGAGPRLSDHLIASQSTSMRWLGVSVAVASLLPWIAIIVLGMSAWDEFQRHVALVGTSLAFVVELLFYTAFFAMHDAGLIGADTFAPYLLTTMLIWVGALGITALYYRIRP